jgi:hypothetical protein
VIRQITLFPYSWSETRATNRESTVPSFPHLYNMTIINECHSIAPPTLDVANTFPIISPIVTFTGPVINSGHTLLCDNATTGLGDTQLKCCGFIQLSSYITPGNPDNTPFKGYHPFQVFVIFPIHVKPWSLLCKGMVDKQETCFKPNTLFSCVGKVAGFLDHSLMVYPPQLTQDYIFIIVPDDWRFWDKKSLDSISVSPSKTTPTKQPSTDPFDPARFISQPKQTTQQATQQAVTPTMTAALFNGQKSNSEPTDPIPWC